MNKVKIAGIDYWVASEWSDITIKKAATLCSIRMPESLKGVYDIVLNPGELSTDDHYKAVIEAENKITPDDQYKHIPSYFLKVIEVLSDIPGDVLQKTDINSIRTVYHTYLKKFIEGILYYPSDINPKEITEFEFRGVKYLLPQSKSIFGINVPMVDMTALEFVESADLMIQMTKAANNREFIRIANMVSILCRPEGEKYDEAVSLVRAVEFQDLTMDIVWSVFFSLITPLIILNQYVQISFLQGMAENRAKQQMN